MIMKGPIEFKPGRLSQSLTLTVMEQSAVR